MDAPSARTHVVVVSDLHLSEPEPGDSAWLRYRQPRFFPDADFAALVAAVRARLAPGERLEWVFGGDVFELEGPEIVDGETRFPTAARGADEARGALLRIVEAHPALFDAVVALVDDGHRVVFVAGNHDVQLTLPEVAAALVDALAKRARSPEAVFARVSVRPWFHRAALGVHVEHGHQYDPYCAYRNPVAPLAPRSGGRPETMGSLSFRHLVQRMGFFNAHDERTFMLSVPAYLAHWVRNYAFSRRSLALTWFVGALRTVSALLRGRPSAVERRAIAEASARDLGSYVAEQLGPARHDEVAARHAALFAEPADEALGRVLRELHLDQVICVVIAALGAALVALGRGASPVLGLGVALISLAAAFPVAQAWLSPKRALAEDQRRVDAVARRLAEVYEARPIRAVVLGHTHAAHALRERGVLVANCGAWTPMREQTEACDRGQEPPPAARPFVWLSGDEADARAPLAGGLFKLRGGAIEPAPSVVTSAPRAAPPAEPAFAPAE